VELKWEGGGKTREKRGGKERKLTLAHDIFSVVVLDFEVGTGFEQVN